MIDMLTQMSLIQFGLFSIGCLVLGHIWLNFDGSTHYPMPTMTQFNAFELAALNPSYFELITLKSNYKDKNIIEVALVNLWHRQLLEITDEGNIRPAKPQEVSHQQFENDIEKVVYQFARTEREPDEFFDTDLRSQLEPHIKSIHQHLEYWHLKRTSDQRKQVWIIAGIVCFLILSIGGIVLLNQSFLEGESKVASLITLFVLILFLMTPLSKYFGCAILNTKLGCRYRKKLTQHFKWLKSKKNSTRIDPALVIALFDMRVLTRFEAFAPFAETFSKSSDSGGSGDGGCGGD
jgi:uncharacterized protein (TIGR04222 family)